MFDLTTIITLVAPAVFAPLVVMIALRALERSELTRKAAARITSDVVTRSAQPSPPAVEPEAVAGPAPVVERQAA